MAIQALIVKCVLQASPAVFQPLRPISTRFSARLAHFGTILALLLHMSLVHGLAMALRRTTARYFSFHLSKTGPLGATSHNVFRSPPSLPSYSPAHGTACAICQRCSISRPGLLKSRAARVCNRGQSETSGFRIWPSAEKWLPKHSAYLTCHRV
ncbi:hypothetical protein CC78DRAFT_582223 [Lojkania enalia]|uniref:Uncharacterized protein n=1 Tax=Lojkania enalia TaxID=147567 RepID=A0A9P4KA19_9PLEO|nr:hypothetical protein CC78DRAFT_582223 [Didymosphaeria enalia]